MEPLSSVRIFNEKPAELAQDIALEVHRGSRYLHSGQAVPDEPCTTNKVPGVPHSLL